MAIARNSLMNCSIIMKYHATVKEVIKLHFCEYIKLGEKSKGQNDVYSMISFKPIIKIL